MGGSIALSVADASLEQVIRTPQPSKEISVAPEHEASSNAGFIFLDLRTGKSSLNCSSSFIMLRGTLTYAWQLKKRIESAVAAKPQSVNQTVNPETIMASRNVTRVAKTMQSSEIKIIHAAARRALTILHSESKMPKDEELHCLFFKTMDSAAVVRDVFQQVKEFLTAVVNGERYLLQDWPKFSFMRAGKHKRKIVARVCNLIHQIYLYDSFFDNARYSDDLVLFQAAVLLHELVHYVSCHNWKQFLGLAPLVLTEHSRRLNLTLVHDMRIVERRQTKWKIFPTTERRDDALLSFPWYRTCTEGRSTYYVGPGGVTSWVPPVSLPNYSWRMQGYGLRLLNHALKSKLGRETVLTATGESITQFLAKLDGGEAAALLNADNYSAYIKAWSKKHLAKPQSKS